MATTKRKTPGSKAVDRVETAQIRSRRLLRTHPRVAAFAVGAAFAPWILGPAFAEPASNQLPTGAQVGAGSVAISAAGTKMQVDQASDKAIINWNCFCIGSNAWVNFNQPSASSVVLNRSTQAAEIFGRMSANGQVFVTSGAGVYFARSAQVDVGGLMASSLAIRDMDFLAGRYIFSKDGSAGSVVNDGKINIISVGGYAVLAGPQVQNNGVIVAQAGTVSLAAGDRVSLDMVGDGLIKVSVDAAALNALALNSGTIQADGGNVILTARSANALLDTVINNTGVIRANSLIERGGEIVLDGGSAGIVANSGTITATGDQAGTTGGSVKILGQYVGLFDGTRIDASGDSGGGTVLVGGNFQGKGPEQNAFRTFVGSDASIKADSVTNGDGGKVIVWSDDTTRFYGNISVRGGEQGGDGGFVEVSGKQHLDIRGSVDARAPAGHMGTLLLDPDSINVIHSTTSTWTGTTDTTNPFLGTADSNPDTLTDAFVNTQLANVNATFQTTSGNITFDASSGVITFTGTNKQLAFKAVGGSIVFQGGSGTNTSVSLGTGGLFALDANSNGETITQVGNTNALVLTTTPLWMRAQDGIGTSGIPFLTQGLTDVAAAVTGNGGTGIFITNSVGGNINITTLTATNLGTATLTGLSATSGTGAIIVVNSVSGGTITVSSAIANSDSGSAVTLSANTDITVNAGISTAGSGVISLNIGTGGAGGTLDLSGAGTFTGTTVVGGGAGTDTFIGRNATNAWTISGSNSGVVVTAGNSTASFSGIENVTGGTGADTFTFSGTGHIAGTISGGTGNDTLASANGTNTWAITGANAGTFTDANGANVFTGIENLTGGTGADSFTFSGTGSISGTIAGGTGTDTLTGNNNTTAWTVSSTGGGTISDANGTATFTGIENLVGGSGADTVTFSGTGHITGSIDGGTGTNTLVGNGITTTWTISGTNSGTFNDANGTNAFTSFQNLTGGSGADSFSFTGSGNLSGTLDGGAGVDTLTAGNNTNTWTINGANSGTLFDSAVTTTFTGIENLTGGTGNDSFTITGTGSISGTITGGGTGTDTLTGNNITSAWTISSTGGGTISDANGTSTFTGIENVVGGTGADTFTLSATGHINGSIDGGIGTNTLVGNNATNTWAITGSTSGTLNDATGTNTYTNIQNLTGGSGADSFNFSDTIVVPGVINGGAGANTLNWTAYTTGRTVALTATGGSAGFNGTEASIGGGFQNITALTGAGTGTNSLTGAGLTASWSITGTNTGTYTSGNALTFTTFQNLTGGTGADTFTFAGGTITGALDGGAGTDTLVGNSTSNTWAITGANSGTLIDVAGAHAYTNIENLTGGAGTDNFAFSDGIAIGGAINGLGGVNTLNWSAYTTGRTVTLTAAGGSAGFNGTEASIGGGFQNITALTGAGTGTNSLTGIDATATWTISGANSGTYSSTNSLTFTTFQNLTGGTGADSFSVSGAGNLSGTVNGGTGVDTLTGGANTNTWTISGTNAGTLFDSSVTTTFTGVENLTGGAGTDNFTITTGTISGTLSGAGGTNTLTASNSNTNTWTINGTNAGTLFDGTSTATFTGIQNTQGGSGADTFTFSGTGNLTGTMDGGGGTNTLVGGSGSNTWNITGASSGTLVDANGTHAYTNIQNLTGGSGTDNFAFSDGITVPGVINGGAGANTLNWSAYITGQNVTLTAAGGSVGFNGTVGSITGGFQNITALTGSGTAADTLTGMNSTASWAINALDAGSYTVGGNTTTFTSFQNVTGGTGTDTFTLSATGRISGSIDGGTGTDTLVGNSGTNTWTIAGPASTLVDTNGTNLFNGIENLTGGAGADTFTFPAGQSLAGTIDGAGGVNTINWSAYATGRAVTLTATGSTVGFAGTQAGSLGVGFQNITSLVGASVGGNTLTGINATATWTISGTNSGTYLSTSTLTFTDFQNLTGGTGADSFSISGAGNLSGTVNGGTGVDTLTGGANTNTWTISGANSGTLFDSSVTTTFTGIENLTGGTGTDNFTITTGTISGTLSGAGGTNTLTASNSNTNTWTITGTNAGTLFDGTNTANFTNIQNTQGGSGADTFQFGGGTITGTMDGGGGTNTLVGNNTTNTWVISGTNSGTLTDSAGAHAFTNIQNLTGGSGADSFSLSGSGNLSGTISGGAGTDTLTGGANTNTWTISGTNAGTLFDSSVTTTFTGIENLTGGTGTDNFTITTGTISGTLAGGAGTNTLTSGNFTNTWTINATDAGTLFDGTSTATFTGIQNTQGGSGADNFTFAGTGHITGVMDGGGGSNTVTGGGGPNTWNITGATSGTLVDANGTHAYTNIQNLTGGSGIDNFIFSNTITVPGVIDGGAGVNTLDWSAYTTQRNVGLTAVGGTTGFNGTQASITGGFQNITDLKGSLTANNVITDNQSATASWAINTANAGTYTSSGNTLNFTRFTGLIGGAGDDTFTLSGTATLNQGIIGSAGTNTVVRLGGVGTNNWSITSANTGTLTDDNGVVLPTIGSIQNWTGGTGADTFTFVNPGSSVSGVINGGAGVNKLDWSTIGSGRSVTLTALGASVGFNGTEASIGGGFQNITDLIGAGVGGNTLAGMNATATWAITSTDAGTYTSTNALTYTNFQNLTGGTGADTFVFSDNVFVTGMIDGGAGVNTLDFSAYSTATGGKNPTVILQALGGTTGFNGIETELFGGNSNSFQNINAVVGSNQASMENLIAVTGVAGAANWVINALNAGSYTNTNTLTFSRMQYLYGGPGDDTFTFSGAGRISGADNNVLNALGVSGAIMGNGGTNTLVGNNNASTWTISGSNSGSLVDSVNGTSSFAGIQNLTGGTAADTFTLTTGSISGIIDGGAGTDTLVGKNATNSWTISGTNAGTLSDGSVTTTFTGIENTQGGSGADTFQFAGGTITGTMDGGAGIDTLVGGNGTNTWSITGTNAGTLTDAAGAHAFTNIENLLGGTGADTFSITAPGNLSGTINGGAGTDTMVGGANTNAWTISGANSGTLFDGSVTATFLGIENLTGGAGADNFTITGAGTIGGGTIAGGAGVNTLTGNNLANTWAITGLGAGTLTDANGANAFTGITNVTGGSLADAFTLSGTGRIAGTIDGAGGANALTGNNLASTWALTGSNSGTLTDANGANAFTNIGALTGGSAADSFVFPNGVAVSGTINGGAGANTLNWSAYTTGRAVTLTSTGGAAGFNGTEASVGGGFQNIDTLVGAGAGVSTLTGINAPASWALSGASSGTYTSGNSLTYSNFQNRTGGSGADSFVFPNGVVVSGTINGGAGANTLDWSAYTTGRTVTLTSAGGSVGFNGTEASAAGGFQNISALVGGSGANSLTGMNATASWAINAANSGTYTSGNALAFSAFQNVTGGSGNDTFTLSGSGHITGTINGGSGTDTLVGNNLNSTWVISSQNTGTLTDPNGANAFTSIESLTGGTAADTYTNINVSGALIDLGGATSISTNLTTGGNQSYAGPVSIGAFITIKSTGGSIGFSSTVTDPGFELIVDAAGDLLPGTMNVGAGRVQLFAGGTIFGGAGQSVTGTSTQQNVMSSGNQVNNLNVNFSDQVLLLTGNALLWNLTGPPVTGPGSSPVFQIGNANIQVKYNSVAITGAAVAAIQQSASVIGATLAQISRAALLEAQDTDSVQKQIAYGFAGDVGTTPPMDHRIDETGISVPVCFNASREGQTCQ